MGDSTAFDFRATSAPCELRQEYLLLEIKQKLDDLIYKEQVTQLWKVGMESMMHSVWEKVCSQRDTVAVRCQTDDHVEQVCDTSPRCSTCLLEAVPNPAEEESELGFGAEENSEQKSEGDPAKRSLEGNFVTLVNECDVHVVSVPVEFFTLAENRSSPSVVADSYEKERSEPDSRSRSDNVESYECAHCDAKFSRKDKFSKHQRSHSNSDKQRKRCQHCLRIFKNQRLTGHSNSGACPKIPGKSRYECLECAKSFNTYDTFYHHLVCHKEKGHVCTVCNKAFHFKKHLNEHMRTHTGEKPFFCHVCSKRFSTRGNLNQHARRRHPK